MLCSAVPIRTNSRPVRTRCSARLVPSGIVAIVSRPEPEAAESLEDLTFFSTQ